MADKSDDRKYHWWLYVLRLEDRKWYVGITSKTPEIRMQEHLNGVRTAYWTAKHKPVEIIYREDLGYIVKEEAEKRENKYVRELMRQRGINNVRGGDLRSTEDYIKRFGYIYQKENWELALYIICMIVVFSALLVDKYILVFLPGGIR